MILLSRWPPSSLLRENPAQRGYFDPHAGFDRSNRPKEGAPELFLHAPADELCPIFSPDGRWIAYLSDGDIFVRPFPPKPEGKSQIANGATHTLWSKHGRQLFYEGADNRIMVVNYTANGDLFVPARPQLWSETQLFNPGLLNLDMAPDVKRIAVLYSTERVAARKGREHVTMLLNLFDEVKRRIP